MGGPKKRALAGGAASSTEDDQQPPAQGSFPEGSTLKDKLDATRKSAGLPTYDEMQAAKDEPAPLRRVPMSACCVLLMLVASRSSTNLANAIVEAGAAGGEPAEALKLVSYGLTLLNLTGGLGAVTYGILPGAAAWVHQIAEEASTSVGIALFTVGIAGLADTTGFWTADEMSVSRFVMLGVVTGHCGLKQMFFSKLCAYMQVTATVFAVMLFRLGAEQQDWMIVGAAVASAASNARHHKTAFPFSSVAASEELSYAAWTALCLLVEQASLRMFSARQPIGDFLQNE